MMKKKNTSHSNKLNLYDWVKKNLILLILFTTAFSLRAVNYRIPAEIHNDQAMDLVTARAITRGDFYPTNGPPLSVGNIITPPGYHYVLAGFYKITNNLEGVTYLFLVLNIIAIYFMYLLAKDLLGKRTAYISLFITSITSALIVPARIMWQPHPTITLVAISLFLLLKKKQRYQKAQLILSLVFIFLAISTYPGPVLILPLFLHQSYLQLRSKYSKKIAISTTALYVACTSLIIFIPMLLHVYRIGGINAGNRSQPIFDHTIFMQSLVKNIHYLGNNLATWEGFHNHEPKDSPVNIISFASGLCILWLIYLLPRGKESLFPMTVVGLIGISIFSQSPESQHLHALIPLSIISLSYQLSSDRSRNLFTNIFIGIFAIFIISNNLRLIISTMKIDTSYSISSTRKDVVSYIQADTTDDIPSMIVYTENELLFGTPNSRSYPYVYYLYESLDIPIPINPTSNEIPWEVWGFPKSKKAYLVCDGFEKKEINNICLKNFMKNNPKYKPSKPVVYFPNNISLYITIQDSK